MILSGVVFVNGQRVDKQGTPVPIDSNIEIRKNILPYVSKGGLKLEKALKTFSINPENYICLDIGASTGGFTDCLLKNGAKMVFAVDTGKGQLDYSLIKDKRVKYFENYNARYLKPLDFPGDIFFDMVVIDVSFISQKLILTPLYSFLKERGKDKVEIISLIKPQFEAGRENIKKGGLVKSEEVVREVTRDLILFGENLGFKFISKVPYNENLKRKNTEILTYFIFER